MTDTRRFAAVFATTAAVAALASGIGGLVLGQSHHAAPAMPVSQVGTAQTPAEHVAPSVPLSNPAAAVVAPTNTRTVTITRTVPAKAQTAAKPVKEPKVTEPVVQPAAVAAEPDPTPDPTPAPNYDQPEGPWQKGGQPSSMNGTPDPQVGGTTTPAEPMPGTLPMHPVSG